MRHARGKWRENEKREHAIAADSMNHEMRTGKVACVQRGLPRAFAKRKGKGMGIVNPNFATFATTIK